LWGLGCVGDLAVVVIAPALHGSAGSDSAGMVGAGTHALEGADWWSGPAVAVRAPALDAATGRDSAGVVLARAYALEGTGGWGGLATVTVSTQSIGFNTLPSLHLQ
jgi:hypothetical protein